MSHYFHAHLAESARTLLNILGNVPILVLFDSDVKQEPIKDEIVRHTEGLGLPLVDYCTVRAKKRHLRSVENFKTTLLRHAIDAVNR